MCRTCSSPSKITNPVIPQQAGVIPMPTGNHYQCVLLRYIERATSAANPGNVRQLQQQYGLING